MKILMAIAGFLALVVVVAAIVLIIIAIAKGKIKTPGAPSGKTIKTIVVIGILAAIGWFGYRYFSEYKTQSHPVYTIPTEKWYLSNEQYWKENGGMEQAATIKVDVTEYSMYVIYKLLRRNGQYGELLAESEDGKIYTGRYQYPGESGDVKLKKLHTTLYEGTATRPNGTTMKIQLLKSPL